MRVFVAFLVYALVQFLRESKRQSKRETGYRGEGRRAIVLNRKNILLGIVVFVFVLLVATWGMLGSAVAQKASAPKSKDQPALSEDEVQQLLLLMDSDKDGKVSKQEWMTFMEAEFDRLDKAKNGQLDVKELGQSKLRVSHFSSVGK
jgi:uncharacterized protein YneF (UPF0154 family)